MNIFTKKFTVWIISFSMLVSYGILQSDVFAENGTAYSCDFTQLVKDGAKTMYGTTEDIIQLDEYTTAYLTYAGTYVDAAEYTSPSTTWDFASMPASSGQNTPVIGGNSVWASGEVQFPAADTKTGTLTVDMENAIRNNVTIEFDVIDHSKALGQQFFNFSIMNSEEAIIDFQVHPYDDSRADTKGLIIGGKTVTDFKAIRIAWGTVGTHHIKTDIDYNARKVTVIVGNSSFIGEIPEGTIADIKKLEISSTRSKTAADRYISVDNLKIEEFT